MSHVVGGEARDQRDKATNRRRQSAGVGSEKDDALDTANAGECEANAGKCEEDRRIGEGRLGRVERGGEGGGSTAEREAEERWEVIDVDGTSAAEAAAAAAPSSKRRRVSASTSGGVRQNDAPADAAAGRSSSGTCAIGGASGASNAAATTHASNGDGDTGGSLVVVVEGCGLTELNGTFERIDCRDDGCPVYSKEGRWKGKNAEYWIWCVSAGVWDITVDSNNGTTTWLYCNHTIPNSETPPENGWTMYRRGKSPAPICRITCADP